MKRVSVGLALVLVAIAGLVSLKTYASDAAGAPESSKNVQQARVEVVFCIDTTGSMGGLIAGAQAKIWSIVNGIVAGKPTPQIKVGLVAYRDKGDAYITQVTDLTSDLDSIHQKLFGFKAEGGGDAPEHVNQALDDAVNKISWSPKSEKVYRTIFLVGDAPPHMDYTDDVKYPESCKAAVLKDIVVNTVCCGNDRQTAQIWNDIAKKSEGQYTAIRQDGGVQVVATPFDTEMAVLSGKLIETGVFGGGANLRREAEQAKREALKEADEVATAKDAKKAAVAADRGEYRAKVSSAAANAPAAAAPENLASMGMNKAVGKADLVGAFERDKTKALDGLKNEELPDEMQKMTDGERKEYLAKKAGEREEIRKKIDELSKKRAEFIQEEQKKRGVDNGFDAVVLKMLQEQGAKKGIEYK
jgi:hypothetical protein